jgi:predicted permease
LGCLVALILDDAWQSLISVSPDERVCRTYHRFGFGRIRTLPSMGTNDLRVALRRLRRAPVFLGVSTATLGVAIGVNAAIFSIADAVLFRPLPYWEPQQLYFLRVVSRETGQASSLVPRQLVESLEQHGGVFAGVTFRGNIQNSPHTESDGTELIGNIPVAPSFLNTLGVRPLYGRSFDSSDLLQPGRAVLLTYSSWRNRFGGDPRLIGQSAMIAGYQRDVVGVLPRDFIFPSEGIAYPFAPSGRPHYEFLVVPGRPRAPGGRVTDPLVRLRAGVSLEAGQSELESIARSIAPAFQTRLIPVRTILFPVGTLTLRVLLLAAAFVLLLGCANLSHLFLIRVQERQHEARVCLALGATRLHVVRVLFCEALIVALCGALVALLLALISFNALQQQVPTALSGGALMRVDWRVALFTFGLGTLSAVLFTILPAWISATVNLQSTIFSRRPESSKSGSVGGFGTVIVQVGIAMLLLSTAISAARYFVAVLRDPLGFSPENVLTIDAMPSGSGSANAFSTEVVHKLSGRPDVVSAGAVEALPLSGRVPRDSVPVAGADAIPLVRTLPGYFETSGIRLLQGRLFTWQDSAVSSLAIVSESAAAILFPGRDALGQQLRSEKAGPFLVVGVVSDIRMTRARARDPLVYSIVGPPFDGRMEVIVRLRNSSQKVPAEIRQFVSGLQREMPVTTEWWSKSINSRAEYRTPRFQTIVLGTVAALATTLAALGLFGVVSYSTRSRMHEVAIRLALGAMPESITRRLALQTAWPVAIGLLGGLMAAGLMGRILTAYLVGFRGWEWPVLVAGGGIIACTAMLSTYLPARKASRLPVMTVLNSQ